MTRKIPRHSLLIGLAFLIPTVTSLPVFAGEEPVSQIGTTVKFGDLDLNTDAGRRELLERLSKAAGRVCERYANAHWALGYYQVYSSCVHNSLSAAVNKVHDEHVSALFAATRAPETP